VIAFSEIELKHNNEDEDNSNFAYQAGCEFFFVHGPWIRSGDGLFDTDINNHYNAVERLENEENMYRWLRHQVSSIHLL
jgi:hypothetical protein